MWIVPVYNPLFEGNEKRYLTQCIDSAWVSGGPFVQRFEEAFAKYMGTKYAVAVCNGTAALETMLNSYHLGFVAMSTSTIISCAIATIRCEARPIFKDISLSNGCMREDVWAYDALLVHLFGNESKTDKGRILLEDRSQYWAKKKVTTSACYSLYANKLITCGEGGVVITNDKAKYHDMIGTRNLCHSNIRFIHTGIGYNFRMTDLQGAVALAQLEQIDKFIELRLKVHKWYKDKLPLKCRLVNANAPIPWMTLIETPKRAKDVIFAMQQQGIECRRFFYPLHKQTDFKTDQVLPNANYAWKHWFYLPSGLDLKEKDIDTVCRVLSSTLA